MTSSPDRSLCVQAPNPEMSPVDRVVADGRIEPGVGRGPGVQEDLVCE